MSAPNRYSPCNFVALGATILGGKRYSLKKAITEFKAAYQVHPKTCSKIWRLLQKKGNFNCLVKPHHLLWTFFFMKSYNIERVSSQIVRCDRKNFRKYIGYIIKQIYQLRNIVVSFNTILM